MKNIILILFPILFFYSCASNYRGYKEFALSPDAQSWKNDTCGLKYLRYDIASKIKRHKKIFIGIKDKELTRAIGEPDFIRSYDMSEYPDAIFYEYSLSSVERINGKCGDPATYSLCFIIHKDTHKVIGIQRDIY